MAVGHPKSSPAQTPIIGTTIADSVPHWPDTETAWAAQRRRDGGIRNVLMVVLDDVGFADFGCYGSEIETPTIDALAADGIRYTGFHTTAMCSTTRASLLTGRNHHSVGMGCLANFDSGFPGYRGKIDAEATTLAEHLRPHGFRNYMIGKWHVTRLTETGPSGPFDGWPLGRGFDRFYGFLDAETDQYSPELVQDNSHITPPGTYETGYHLTTDLIDHAIEYLAGHYAVTPDQPWFTMLSPGACHAPHQAPVELIDHYSEIYAKGWDQCRADRLAQQIQLGIVPEWTELPPRNDMVEPWDAHSADEQRLFARLAGAYAAMLDHFDRELARLIDFLNATDQFNQTLILIMSDNGASQEGGPRGFVNAMGPFNMVPEDMALKLARIDDIGGPDTHSNVPWGWAMASNTPLRRYKQNTHGGGVRDPLVLRAPGTDPAIVDQFCHASDIAPTITDLLGLPPLPEAEGVSFAATVADPNAPTAKHTQYFEMFGHRGIWHEGWKAVAFHQPGTNFDDDVWELYDLRRDVNELHDLAASEPERLAMLKERWWEQARAHKVLPLDDRFAPRFAENAARHLGDRVRYEFHAGMGHLSSDVAPDLRARSYTITATIDLQGQDRANGVVLAHGDATGGYSLYLRDGYLIHDLNIGGHHELLRSDRRVPPTATTVGFTMQRRHAEAAKHPPAMMTPPPAGTATLWIDGEAAGSMDTARAFSLMISWSGLDIGRDRGTTVSDYDETGRFIGPFPFSGILERIVIEVANDQAVDADAAAAVQIARQ